MKKISEITFKDYIEASETFKDYLITIFDLAYIEAINIFKIKPTIELEFVQVKELLKIDSFDDFQMIEYVKSLTNISDIELSNIALLKYKQFIKYLTNEAEKIRTIEMELQYEPTGKEYAAGIEELNKFDYYLQIRQLANNDITKIQIVEKLPYHLCYTELLAQKELNIFEKNLIKLQK
ncbi:MAG: hypothetical protein ACRC0V_07535 [Fusobacteriaceae bacterium]